MDEPIFDEQPSGDEPIFHEQLSVGLKIVLHGRVVGEIPPMTTGERFQVPRTDRLDDLWIEIGAFDSITVLSEDSHDGGR